MGIVIRHAFWNSVFSQLGTVLGLVNVIILFPAYFTQEEFGLTRILVAISMLFVQVSSLGGEKVVIKFYPLYRETNGKSNGLLLIALFLSLIGFIVFGSAFFFLKEYILGYYADQSSLFHDYYEAALLISGVMLFNLILESMLQAVNNTVLTAFLKNVLVRLIWMAEIFAYHFGYISFEAFVYLFIGAYCLNTIIMLIVLMYRGQFDLKLTRLYARWRMLKRIVVYGFFVILSGLSSLIANRIDIIMIGFMLTQGLNNVSIYSLAVYIGSVIYFPSLALGRVSMPMISEFWKSKQLDRIKSIYVKSSINQLLLGAWIFVCTWICIDEIYTFVPDNYNGGKYVIFFIGLARLIDMITGVNGVIVAVSKIYRYTAFIGIGLVVLTIGTNLWLIPRFGIVGAALATAIAMLVYNTIRIILVWVKLGMQPFSWKTAVSVLVVSASAWICSYFPSAGHDFLDILIKCTGCTLLIAGGVYGLKLSDDLIALPKALLSKITNRA